jgi:hypothetical protein
MIESLIDEISKPGNICRVILKNDENYFYKYICLKDVDDPFEGLLVNDAFEVIDFIKDEIFTLRIDCLGAVSSTDEHTLSQALEVKQKYLNLSTFSPPKLIRDDIFFKSENEFVNLRYFKLMLIMGSSNMKETLNANESQLILLKNFLLQKIRERASAEKDKALQEIISFKTSNPEADPGELQTIIQFIDSRLLKIEKDIYEKTSLNDVFLIWPVLLGPDPFGYLKD